MAAILHIDTLYRRIDEELAKASAKYGPRHCDIVVLEGGRGDTMDDMELLRALRYLNLTGSRFKAILKQVTPE
jgi:hypothetical protein